LEEGGVAVTPGLPFGAEGFIRFSFANAQDQIKKGMDSLKQFAEQN